MAGTETQQIESSGGERRVSRAQRLRERMAETANQESVAGMEQIFEAKLTAVNVYEKQLAAVTIRMPDGRFSR